ncbi:hypothetical protein [Chelativorans sp. Marseille-P2723]|uniref:hypothetical protein n=1 Tax=Chelativorans sp. Marseille-P2723 TaxID=2709133 RepID=UPI00156FE8DF|nr:hypothetical protein [Chelativorans sp. Marseille-P2723]
MQDRLVRYQEAARRAVDWVIPRISKDGTIAGSEDIVFGYYKALPALWTGGRPIEAGRILNRIRNRFFENGRFETDGDRYPGASSGPGYRHAWFVIGAHMMGAYDVSMPAIATMELDLDPDSGGVGNGAHDPAADWGTTCNVINALLAGNRVEAAVKAGQLIERMLEAQSNPRRMIMRWDPQRGIFDPSPDIPRKGWNIGIGERKQTYWYIGIAMYTFARLYEATGEKHWLGSADKLLEFALACREDFAGNMNTSKLAWGASQMAAHSANPQYKELAMEVADWIAQSQCASGIWVRNPDVHTEETQPIPITLDATLDRAFYLTEVIAALA